jgi:hypothetical protein
MDITNRKHTGMGSIIRVKEIGDTYKGFTSVKAVRDDYDVKCDKCAFLMNPECHLVSCHNSEDDDGRVDNIDIVWQDGHNKG